MQLHHLSQLSSNPMKLLPKFSTDTWIVLGIIFLNGFSWSWLFLSKVSELSESTIIGYALAVFAFLAMVAIGSYIYCKTVFYFIKKFKSKKLKPWVLVELFFVWSVISFAVSWLSTIIWMGRNGSLDTVLPFANFTPSIAHTPLVYLSRFIGFYGMSGVVAVLVAVILVKNLRKFAIITISTVAVLNLLAWGLYKSPDGHIIKAQIVADKLHETQSVIANSPDIVVLPEYGISPSLDFTGRFQHSTSENNTYYVGSRQNQIDNGHQNVLVFGSTQRGVTEQRVKSRLIPGGEYLPYIVDAILQVPGTKRTRDYFMIFKSVDKGTPNYQPLIVNDDIKLGSSICASIIATEDYRRFTSNGATVLTNSASLGIFNSVLFTFQHHGLAKFMAVANARPFLQASNDATAFALDHNGRMLAKVSPVNVREIKVSTNTRRTPHTLLGEWPVYAGFVVMAAYALNKLKHFSKKP